MNNTDCYCIKMECFWSGEADADVSIRVRMNVYFGIDIGRVYKCSCRVMMYSWSPCP